MSNPDVTSPEATGRTTVAPEEEPTEQKALTNDNKEIANLEQYILSRNIDRTTSYNSFNKDKFSYKTFRQINGPGPQIVNRLRGVDNLEVFYKMKTSVLSLLQPKIRIYKVNYEEIDLDEAGMAIHGSNKRLPVPCYREFKFSDNFGQETAASVQDYLAYESTRPTWRNVGLKSFSIEQDGRTHGVIEQNIKCNLTLSFKSLKDLQAQPPGEPPPEKGGVRYVDLILWPGAKFARGEEVINPLHYEIKVLMGYTAPSKQALENLNLTATEMNAVLGIEKLNSIVSLSLLDYDLKIRDDGRVDMVATYRGRLETVMATNQVNIFHDSFRVSKAGGFESVDYSVKSKFNTAHIYNLATQINTLHSLLKSPSCKDSTCEARQNLKSLIESDEVFGQIYLESNGQGVKDKKGKKVIESEELVFSWFKDADNTDAMLALLKKKVGAYKKDIYRTFFDALVKGNDEEGSDTNSGRLFCVSASKKEIQKAQGIVLVDDTDTSAGVDVNTGEVSDVNASEQIRATTAALPRGQEEVKVGRCSDLGSPQDKLRILSETAAMMSDSLEDESESKDTEATSSPEEDNQPASITYSHDGEKYNFYFLYLGDIVELACRNAGFAKIAFDEDVDNQRRGQDTPHSIFPNSTYQDKLDVGVGYPLQNARLLLGPIDYVSAKDGQIKTINLAQYPISFNLFRTWFLKYITSRRRAAMPLGAFINLLINNLVIPSLGAAMPKSIKAPHTSVNMVSVTLPGKSIPESDSITVCGRPMNKFEEILPLKRVINTESGEFKLDYFDKVSQPQPSETMMKTSFDYFLVYVTAASNIIERRGRPSEDNKDGIYHFNIGSDTGLLKKMTFNKVTIKDLAELRSEQAIEQGVDQLNQLTIPYNTNLTMVGNPLFFPGMFYYVNPSLAGLGSIEDSASLSYKLNLGGYHIIMKVRTTLSPGKYETVVEGTQTAQGRR